MNHKRKRPKNRRAGCLMCKPHKMNGGHRCAGKPALLLANRLMRAYREGRE